MSSESILIILSYTVSTTTQCRWEISKC